MAKTPKNQALGKALRQAREENGLTLRALGKRLERDPGVLSRWETGDRTPRPEQVAQVLTSLGINGERYEEVVELAHGADAPNWVATTLPAQRQQLEALIDLERRAMKIVEVSPLMIPGLLQTSDYSTAVMRGGGVPEAELAARTSLRLSRRESVTGSQPADLVAFIGEAALYQVIGDRSVLVPQLRFLDQVAARPNIELRIVPLASGWHPGLEGPFLLIRTGLEEVVQLENRKSGLFLHEQADVKIYREAVGMIESVSRNAHESRAIIADLARRMEERR
ncbi:MULTISPECIES: Scr1 family TA system antitoxin-like transcriptional regulator [unclassified Saccharopolyspora]|uniref:helix-turn-helix domain-containing protein n=1 Tax=unclassified Saccharopolyspora TaxID=2646250 RepID=UPI001CD3330F|nr:MULTISPECIES: Scr1 family TA system antitoxin-like transcriptional regulator [unclassified Saccharopolyspora]MCA1187390.1 Scr1 family TA system antitoxin-like transcriptional regulator [Saccharopolyspora sp. 6T]MCA1194279.1 Scr1 family TA system antitoxin-like transcriptional regulator [Saccharopolyspora sp. 6V]MCA1224758.1 Scr1 family TA system antitoxin-like transcriptional regulator [Saccharopolyspora sp. 6M]MCA1280897.1 Scr1 family TA system antitoxin-like transcriptional regulator [Sacc